jgi:hypothetical protein
MAILLRRSVVLAKIETTYGVNASTVAADNAILIRNFTATPLQANIVPRDVVRPYLGNFDQLIADKRTELSFEVELAGTVAPGDVPGYDPLLRACAFTKSVVTSAITITRTGSTATATLVAHGFTEGSQVRISGASQSQYNGLFTISNVTNDTFDYTVAGSPTTPATGSPVVGRRVEYSPVSSNFESVTIDYFIDGIRQRLLGARGNVELEIAASAIPVYRFRFVGLYTDVVDEAIPSGTNYDKFQTPQIPNPSNTSGFAIFGETDVKLKSFRLDMANAVEFRPIINEESVLITNRLAAGELVVEMPLVSELDIFQKAIDAENGVFTIVQGNRSGNRIKIDCQKVNFANPTTSDDQGILMANIPIVAIPNVGDDEILITTF